MSTTDLVDPILEAIAIRTAYDYGTLKAFYDHYKSYDLIVASVDYCATNGFTSLRVPPIIEVVTCPNCQASVGVSRNVGYVKTDGEKFLVDAKEFSEIIKDLDGLEFCCFCEENHTMHDPQCPVFLLTKIVPAVKGEPA